VEISSRGTKDQRNRLQLFKAGHDMDETTTDLAPTRPVVLIVEDELLIRLGAVEVFLDAGFDVLEAADADAALVLLRSTRIDLVFTDVNMPGSMDGVALARLIRSEFPAIGTIVTSGKVDSKSIPLDMLFLEKPYKAGELTSATKTILSVLGSPMAAAAYTPPKVFATF
jgi:two-component system, response regulator PdtaR